MIPPARLVRRVVAASALGLAGCGGDASPTAPKLGAPPVVQVIRPVSRTIVRTVKQPGFIDAFEQTAIYPKMTAYLEKWIVDIGDKVQKDQVMATLFVPELREEHETKKAEFELASQEVLQAEKLVAVAEADVNTASARVAEAKADLGRYQAEVDRWEVQVKRLTTEAAQGVVDRQVLEESTRQLRSNVAARDAANASILAASSADLSARASLDKARVDVDVARAKVRVAESTVRRLAALVGYLRLTAPYDGIVVARNANTGDFVLPATGDPSASGRTTDMSTANAAPIYVVARTDLLRIYVDVPEKDANFVEKGTPATVLARAYADREIPAQVTRTAWALNVKSRTLRTEIDLPNPDEKILPGMYAYGHVIITRKAARAVPLEAIQAQGDDSFCWVVRDGKARRLGVETGISDGSWVEITNQKLAADDGAAWAPMAAEEAVVAGDTSELTDGETVRIDAGAARSRAATGPSPAANRPASP